MPRCTLIHNPTSGDGAVSGDRLRSLLGDQGYQVRYATTDDDLDTALQEPGDLVVAAGGDGTVGRAASRIFGRGVPLLVLPLGTANNVATALGLLPAGSAAAAGGDTAPGQGHTGERPDPLELAQQIIEGHREAGRRRLDVGRARGPWGVRHFIESFGSDVFAHSMPFLSALHHAGDGPEEPAEKLRHDRSRLAALVRKYRPRPVALTLDGRRVEGELLLVEAMNGPLLGPNVHLAPHADPGDGQLDVVVVRESGREWLARLAAGEADPGGGSGDAAGTRGVAPGVEVHRVSSLSFPWHGETLHIDGRSWGDQSARLEKTRTVEERPDGAVVEVGVEEDGVWVLVPQLWPPAILHP